MCYSALVRQNLLWLAKRYGAEVAWEMFEELFRRRIEDTDIQLARSLDVHVLQMTDERARGSQAYIEQYRTDRSRAWEQELFKQRKRLVDAQRKLQVKETKAARNDERIATDKLAALAAKLSLLRSEQLSPVDSRIFPKKYYVPLIVDDGGRLVIRPMRYTPPPEILATGHTRCVISLKEGNVGEWLSPGRTSRVRLEEILSDRQAPYYEDRIAA
jgi:hypothetical protein